MRSSDRYMRALAAVGLSVEDIDFVMCTHLHVDHVGWNTRLVNGRWVPTFPNARYLFGDREFAFRSEEHTSELQSLMRISYAVFCLKKKNNNQNINITVIQHNQEQQ